MAGAGRDPSRIRRWSANAMSYLVLALAMAAIYKIAETDNKSGFAWAGVTLLLTILIGRLWSLYLATPLIAAAIAFVLMLGMNLAKDWQKN